MKKIIIGITSLAISLNLKSQQVINLSTGIADNFSQYNSWGIPPAAFDDTWKVKVPGSNTYITPLVSNGVVGAFGQNYQPINYNVAIISPYVHTIADPGNSIAIGNLKSINLNSQYNGQYIYRTQFNYIKSNCNSTTNAIMYFSTLTAGAKVTDVMINGYSQPILNQGLDFIGALGGAFMPPVPQPNYSFPISVGDLKNGLNDLFVTVDYGNTPGINITGLMLAGGIQIYNESLLSTAGSSTTVCAGTNGTIKVDILNSPGTNNPISNSNFNVQIKNPVNNTIIYNGPAPATVQVTPSATTTYPITITNTLCNKVSLTSYTITTKTGKGCSGITPLRTSTKSDENIQVSPNPSQGIFNIKSEVAVNAYVVKDIYGNVVLKSNAFEMQNEFTIDMGTNKKGLYILYLESSEGPISKRLILE